MLSLNRNVKCRKNFFFETKENIVKKNKFLRKYSVLQKKAHTVVIGGGIIGTSIAYHLSKEINGSDVVLLEQDRLTSGTTWHAAGLMVTFGSWSETSIKMRQYSRDLYIRLEEETGLNTGFMPVGFIELASNKDRLEEFRRIAAFNRKCGVDVKEIGPQDVKDLFPLCNVDDIEAGFYVKEDGRVNPADVTQALAKGARMGGVKIIENEPVDQVIVKNGKVFGVRTMKGEVIECENVVNCAGMWARQLGEKNGVCIPNQAAEHYYLITDKMPEVDPKWPVIEDPHNYTYIRPEAGGLMIGLFEAEAAAWNVNKIPDFSFGSIGPDWDRISPYLERAMSRVPASLDVGTKLMFCGPESFTPDLSPLLGEAPEIKNYYVAAGLNSIGILTGGGIGRLMAHWVVHKRPDQDVTAMNIDRVQTYMSAPEYRAHRVVESLGLVYKCHYPSYTAKSARGVKKSAIYDRLKERGAYFKEVSGFEGADWYSPPGVEPKIDKLTWGRENWWPYWEKEHKACREGVILMDMSFMSKFLVQGKDAGKFLNRLSTANVDGKINEITYTQWLNEDGKMEADLTVSKLAKDKFFVVATDTMHRHVETWMKYHCDENDHVFITDVTGAYCQINLQGPKSRELLAELTANDVSDTNLPFRGIQDIFIGYAPVICTRITYLGELGYELYIPTEFALHVYDRIVEVGDPKGLVHAGLKALASLRMEKAYRDFGHDMDNTDTLLEVGLGFTCDFSKKEKFIGQDAVEAQKNGKKLYQRLVQVQILDPEPLMFHAELLYRNGKRVGDIRAASYGHTLGGAVGLSMIEPQEGQNGLVPITKKYIDSGEWEVEIVNKKYPAKISLRPLYDPENSRIKM